MGRLNPASIKYFLERLVNYFTLIDNHVKDLKERSNGEFEEQIENIAHTFLEYPNEAKNHLPQKW